VSDAEGGREGRPEAAAPGDRRATPAPSGEGHPTPAASGQGRATPAASGEGRATPAASGEGRATPAQPSGDEADERSLVELRADLDLPGETGRQARIFSAWIVCLILAVIVASLVGAHVSIDDDGTARAAKELSRSRVDKTKVALVLGLLLPALLTFGINRRYRRGGGHARGIQIDVTEAGELRIWGRGYGSRVALRGAEVSERLVDVYAGRLGAWRQRRLRVRGTTTLRGGAREIELATTARELDQGEDLPVEGGEGDCVELAREDFDRLRPLVLEAANTPT
jgi:hypothetical protein